LLLRLREWAWWDLAGQEAYRAFTVQVRIEAILGGGLAIRTDQAYFEEFLALRKPGVRVCKK
jgi:hypothetical protein